MIGAFENTVGSEDVKLSKVWERDLDFASYGFNNENQFFDYIEDIITNTENYIDEGGFAKVFEMSPGLCIKVIDHEVTEDFDGAIMPELEFNIHDAVSSFANNDIKVPKLIALHSGDKNSAIVMEQLQAVTLHDVLYNVKELPENFDINTFFDKLSDYLEELFNETGIVHGDLNDKNIMIDSETGEPCLIDFGMSKDKNLMTSTGLSEKLETDLDTLDAHFQSMIYHLQSR